LSLRLATGQESLNKCDNVTVIVNTIAVDICPWISCEDKIHEDDYVSVIYNAIFGYISKTRWKHCLVMVLNLLWRKRIIVNRYLIDQAT